MNQSRHLEKLEHFKAYNPTAAQLRIASEREVEEAETLTRRQRVVCLVCSLIAAGIMIETLFFKFSAAPESVYIFKRMGTEPWMRLVQGLWELTASIGLLLPRLRWAGVAQFAGGVAGVALVAAIAGTLLAHPSVNYVATLPGWGGTGGAFLGEVVIALILMSVVLVVSNTQKLARYAGLFAGACVAAFITFEAPISGMSMNPARTFGSAVLPQLWDSLWIYFLAPPLGMLTAAAVHLRLKRAVGCAKLHHQNKLRCIFCEYQASKQKAIQLDKSVEMSLPFV